MIRTAIFAAAAAAAAVTVSSTAYSEPRAIHEGISGPFRSAERGEQTQTAPPPTPVAPPVITPGDCESVRRVVDYFDPSGSSSMFFLGQGIAWRESRCGLDTYNEASGDSGVLQLNPAHARPGYIGGQYFAAGGWLYALHGLRPGVNTLSPEWINAAITLRQVCGNGPWVRPYSCANNPLVVEPPMLGVYG